MPGIEPYEALFFFAADDSDEVNRDYKQAYDDGGFLRRDVLADIVTVVAVEYIVGHGDCVWFIRKGMLERRDSWMVRKYE